MDYVRCKHCGSRFMDHGGANNPHGANKCPANKPFPEWPSTIKDEKKAGELMDRRLVAYWTARATSFEAMS